MTKKTQQTTKKYTSANIKSLTFPENVRANASQYIGGTDAAGLWLIGRELLDNGVDEAMAGRNNAVMFHQDSDGTYWVLDKGQGVPQGITKTTIHVNGEDVVNKMPTMQAVFGALHTSGKYDAAAYDVSIGTHGIGAKGTNACSEFFEVWTKYEGQWYHVSFKRGVLDKPVSKCKAPKGPGGTEVKGGTCIRFKPDAKIFSTLKFPISAAHEWAETMSYFNPGLGLVISNAKTRKVYQSKNGARDYVDLQLKKLDASAEAKYFEYKSEPKDPNAAGVVVAFSDYGAFALKGYTNGLMNSEGGNHIESVTGALYTAIRPYMKIKKVKGKDVVPFRESDLKEGMVGLVNAQLHKAKFTGQNKAKLSDERMGPEFEAKLEKAAAEFFKANKALAERLCAKATKLNEIRTKFTLSKKAATSLSALKRNGLPAKYAGFDSRTKIQDRELFIVEGDSAGGSAKQGRYPYQAVLPLKGKIMNALKNGDKALESDEVLNVLAAVGYDPKAADPLAKIQIGKIICLADPDPDGPFVGETLIRARNADGVIIEAAIGSLATISAGQGFEVPVWTGRREVWSKATASLVRNVDVLYTVKIGEKKFQCSEDHKWLCVRTRSVYGRTAAEFEPDEQLVYVATRDLKTGDRVFAPANNGTKDPALTDRETRLGYQVVTKIRSEKQEQPVPVYCLTIPGHHNFVLPSGIVSSNCHINSLLLTLFYRYLPGLFEAGMIYVADAPEFYAMNKSQLFSGDTLSEVQNKIKAAKAPASTSIRHIKGWGNIKAPLMRFLAMNPETRRLIKIGALTENDHTDFVPMMDDNVEFRREMMSMPVLASHQKRGRVKKEATPEPASEAVEE